MVGRIYISEKIIGLGVYTFKVGTTIKIPKVVVDDLTEISRELIDYNPKLILCMDKMFISQQAFFKAIDKCTWFCVLVSFSV